MDILINTGCSKHTTLLLEIACFIKLFWWRMDILINKNCSKLASLLVAHESNTMFCQPKCTHRSLPSKTIRPKHNRWRKIIKNIFRLRLISFQCFRFYNIKPLVMTSRTLFRFAIYTPKSSNEYTLFFVCGWYMHVLSNVVTRKNRINLVTSHHWAFYEEYISLLWVPITKGFVMQRFGVLFDVSPNNS